MPLSKARLSRRADLASSTSPHQPVLTVQTPKPTSDTRMPVSPRLRYLIQKPLVSYFDLVYRKSYHILPASAVDVFSLFRNADHALDLHGPGVVQPDPESEHPVDLVSFFGCELIKVLGNGFGVALDKSLHIALSVLYHLPSCLEALDLLAGTSLLGPQGLH